MNKPRPEPGFALWYGAWPQPPEPLRLGVSPSRVRKSQETIAVCYFILLYATVFWGSADALIFSVALVIQADGGETESASRSAVIDCSSG